eukprot:Hpha_TRINITY_DN1551_c0_g1::TRINITY_DN1551_c0_g1_i1::g.57292::m.57292
MGLSCVFCIALRLVGTAALVENSLLPYLLIPLLRPPPHVLQPQLAPQHLCPPQCQRLFHRTRGREAHESETFALMIRLLTHQTNLRHGAPLRLEETAYILVRRLQQHVAHEEGVLGREGVSGAVRTVNVDDIVKPGTLLASLPKLFAAELHGPVNRGGVLKHDVPGGRPPFHEAFANHIQLVCAEGRTFLRMSREHLSSHTRRLHSTHRFEKLCELLFRRIVREVRHEYCPPLLRRVLLAGGWRLLQTTQAVDKYYQLPHHPRPPLLLESPRASFRRREKCRQIHPGCSLLRRRLGKEGRQSATRTTLHHTAPPPP